MYSRPFYVIVGLLVGYLLFWTGLTSLWPQHVPPYVTLVLLGCIVTATNLPILINHFYGATPLHTLIDISVVNVIVIAGVYIPVSHLETWSRL